jgi:phage terminase large subunit GpA-like protein
MNWTAWRMQQAANGGIPSSRPITFRALARGLRPPRRRSVADWAAERRIVSAESGSPWPGKWSNARAPYLVEVMECLSLSHPAETVTFKKSAQVAGTEGGLNFIGSIVEDEPCAVMVVLPTGEEVKKYSRTKLGPMIDSTPVLKGKVRDQKSRDETGSTGDFKKFPGGYVQLVGANSSVGFNMVTYRVVIAEEISEYPFDVDGRGDPLELAFQRTQGWEGRRKIFYNSTPGLAGICRITAKYELSDQRQFYMPCPHCGMYQRFKWSRLDKEALEPAYSCGGCGCDIDASEKPRMMSNPRQWLKCFQGDGCPPEFVAAKDFEHFRSRSSDGRDPGFSINALYSPSKSWRQIVKEWREAKGLQEKEKVFSQQVLGEAWAIKGDAPDHQKLFDARTGDHWRKVPHRALLITGACDVQGDRLEWAVYAYGATFTSWLIDKGVIEGDPTGLEVWAELDKVIARTWMDQHGKPWSLDAFAVDAGYMSQQVYRFTRRYATTRKVFAIKGVPGWSAPAIGTPGKVDIDFNGKKIGSTLIWPVGTWNQKSEIYSAITHLMAGPNKETGEYAVGTAFYGDVCDLTYCEQLTSEQVVTRKGKRGATEMVWEVVTGRRNEALDVAVYSRALAHHLADGMTPEQWGALAAQRGAKPEDVQRDLAALWAPLVSETPPVPRAPVAEDGAAGAEPGTIDAPRDWISGEKDHWR